MVYFISLPLMPLQKAKVHYRKTTNEWCAVRDRTEQLDNNYTNRANYLSIFNGLN